MGNVHLQWKSSKLATFYRSSLPAQFGTPYGLISFLSQGRVQADGSGQTSPSSGFHDPKIGSDLHYFD